MKINPDDLRRHYASLPDGALMAIDRHELTELARSVYDAEMAQRRLMSGQEAEDLVAFEDEVGIVEHDDGPEPDWVSDASCACSFTVRNPNSSDVAADASAALRAAKIPCHVTVTQEDPPKADSTVWYSLRLMVPHGLALNAMSVLDQDVFNVEQEAEWRSSFEMLSDDDLRALDPEVLCAGLLDRVARLRRAYGDEMARRNLTRRRSVDGASN